MTESERLDNLSRDSRCSSVSRERERPARVCPVTQAQGAWHRASAGLPASFLQRAASAVERPRVVLFSALVATQRRHDEISSRILREVFDERAGVRLSVRGSSSVYDLETVVWKATGHVCSRECVETIRYVQIIEICVLETLEPRDTFVRNVYAIFLRKRAGRVRGLGARAGRSVLRRRRRRRLVRGQDQLQARIRARRPRVLDARLHAQVGPPRPRGPERRERERARESESERAREISRVEARARRETNVERRERERE